jgi:hypothetical protein
MSALHHDQLSDEMKQAAAESERLYGDIIGLPRPVSGKHMPSSRDSRAAQFSPFAALTGYDEAIRETARLTVTKPELSEEQKEKLDEMIQKVMKNPSPVTIVFYRMDDYKEGGGIFEELCTITAVGNDFLRTDTGLKIPLEDVLEIR